MKPEDLADTIYVVPAKMKEDSIEITIRIDRNCMLIGLPASGEEARKWEELLRTYARYLILKAINLYDHDPEEPPSGPTTDPPR